jgi:hypothetical protein
MKKGTVGREWIQITAKTPRHKGEETRIAESLAPDIENWRFEISKVQEAWAKTPTGKKRETTHVVRFEMEILGV